MARYNDKIFKCESKFLYPGRYPGFWEVPMLQLKDTTAPCSMFDACHRFSSNTADGVFEFFKTNFDRHYETSTAPFPLFAHASWMMHPAFNFRKQGKTEKN